MNGRDPSPHQVYLYCVTQAADGERFSVAGIGGMNDVPYAIAEARVAAIVSDLADNIPEVTKETLLAHQRVLEEVMKDRAILPVAFGTICDDAQTVRHLLSERAADLGTNLERVNDRVELGLKVFWNLETILKEVAEKDQEVLRVKKRFRNQPRLAMPEQVEAGKAVEAALQRRKQTYVREILSHLACIAADHCLNEEFTDEMVLNAAFLVDKGQETLFDDAISALGERHKDYLQFLYSGPWPPYNFTHSQLVPESTVLTGKEEADVSS